jgi:hypothetical protein
MSLSTELLIGIVLIGLGLLLGAAAYMVLSSRNDSRADATEDEDEEETREEAKADLQEPQEDDQLDAGSDALQPEVKGEEVEQMQEELREETSAGDVGVDQVSEVESEPEDLAVLKAPAPPEASIPDLESSRPEAGPRIQVATLLRDEVSGELIVKVGDHEYRSADELRESRDWTRVEFAASDLSKWIDQPIRRPTTEREVEPGERGKPLSMIEQIDEILQRKIEASGQSQLAVRLIEGHEGSARVLIGVNSYELGEVPDESISDLIREAVAEWEASA